jgi:hypothetical protein
MRDVDLRLAASYLPAGVCMLKVGCLVGALWAVEEVQCRPLYVLVGVGVLLDRHHQPEESILDASGVLLGLFVGHLVNGLRVLSRDDPSGPLAGLFVLLPLSLLWALVSVHSIAREMGLSPCWAGCSRARMSLECAAFFVCWVAFCPREAETGLERLVGRPTVYALFCVVWVYLVDLARPCALAGAHPVSHGKGRQLPAAIGLHFVAVLYIERYVSALYVGVVGGLLAYGLLQATRRRDGKEDAEAPVVGPGEDVSVRELERILRDARSQRCTRL